jgi:hypothetical protein
VFGSMVERLTRMGPATLFTKPDQAGSRGCPRVECKGTDWVLVSV